MSPTERTDRDGSPSPRSIRRARPRARIRRGLGGSRRDLEAAPERIPTIEAPPHEVETSSPRSSSGTISARGEGRRSTESNSGVSDGENQDQSPGRGKGNGRTPPDADPVLPRVATGDPAAINECYDRFGGLVWSLARRFCPNASDAEDAVQEIFIDVWKSAARYDSEIASETTFVAMIARRRLIDRNRRRQRRPPMPTLPEQAAAPAEAVGEEEQSEDVRLAAEAFEKLRPEQKQVLRLAIHHGCSHEQIATTTGMPLGTVKTHARRGLIKIREILRAQGKLMDEAGNRPGEDDS